MARKLSIGILISLFIFIMPMSENHAQTRSPIKIGFITPMTGPVSYDGPMLKDSLRR